MGAPLPSELLRVLSFHGAVELRVGVERSAAPAFERAHLAPFDDRLVLLLPEAWETYRDRGLVRAELGHIDAAMRDLSYYLANAEYPADHAMINERLEELRAEIMNAPLVSCSQAMVYILGLSMAAWNMIAALIASTGTTILLLINRRNIHN